MAIVNSNYDTEYTRRGGLHNSMYPVRLPVLKAQQNVHATPWVAIFRGPMFPVLRVLQTSSVITQAQKISS